MNRSIVLKPFTLCVLLASLTISVRAAEPLADAPKVIDLGTKDVSVYLAVPNLDKLITTIETLGKKFNPDLQPGAIRTLLGIQGGDGNLPGIDNAKPIVAMLLNSPPGAAGPPSFALFIPVKNEEPYKSLLNDMAALAVEVKDGVLIASQSPKDLVKAVELKSVYEKIAAEPLKTDVRVFIAVDQLVESYGKMIEMGMDMLLMQQAMLGGGQPGAVDPKFMATAMKLYAKGLLSLLKQSQTAQIDIKLGEDFFQQEYYFAAKPGSALASLFVEPAQTDNKLLPLLSAGGVMSASARMNPDGFKSFFDKILVDLQADPDFKEVLDEKLVTMMKDFLQVMGSEMVFATVPVEKFGLSTRSAMAVTDEKKLLDLLDSSMALITGPDTFFGKMYASMGMAMKFERNVREYSGVSVHRMKIKLDAEKLPPQQAAQMQAMARDTDLAIVNGIYVTSNDSADLDLLIDQIKAGVKSKDGPLPLQSMKTFGLNRQMYFDYDMLGLVKALLGADPNNPIAGLFANAKAGDPIQVAQSTAGGKLLAQVKVPITPFVEMMKAGQTGIKPPPPPPEKNGQF